MDFGRPSAEAEIVVSQDNNILRMIDTPHSLELSLIRNNIVTLEFTGAHLYLGWRGA